MFFDKVNEDPKLQYETIMGSSAYGTSIGDGDMDYYGWVFPSEEQMFPHRFGYVRGFSKFKPFEQLQFAHVMVDGNEFDANYYDAAKYVRLVADGNPNMLDSLFTPDHCVTFITKAGRLLRDNRKMFLSQRAIRKSIGFARSEMKRIGYFRTTNNRANLIKKYGYDTKSAYHMMRMLMQAEQIVRQHDLDVYDSDRSDYLIKVRNGLFAWKTLKSYANEMIAVMEDEDLPHSTLRVVTDDKATVELLSNLIEEHYGSRY